MIEDIAVDALAGYAFGRLVSHDTVSTPLAQAVYRHLVRVEVPDAPFAGIRPDIAAEAKRLVKRKLAGEELDLRQLHRDGWTRPLGPVHEFVADLLSCPICVSFHATWMNHVVTGRARPLSARWWVRLFASWAGAQVLLRTAGEAAHVDSLVNDAIMEASAKLEA